MFVILIINSVRELTMQPIIRLLVIAFAGIMCSNSMIIRAAALEEDWEQIEIKQQTDALFIQNDSYFDLVVDYYRVNAPKPVSKNLFKGTYVDIADLGSLSSITIRIRKPFEQYGWAFSALRQIPGLTAIKTIGGHLAKNVVPYYGTFESMANYITTIASQTISLNPKSYSPGTILAFYWPVALASLNYPPMIIPLENARASAAWSKLQDTLNGALRTGVQGATTAYHVLQDFAIRQKALNNDQIGKIETIVKDRLPAVQPQPLPKESIFEEYEQHQ